jgi:SET domain-containing protein
MPHGTMKLEKVEFANLKHGSMMVNEYLNSFIQLSRYTTEDNNSDEKKQGMFLKRLNNDIQFQLLNTDF